MAQRVITTVLDDLDGSEIGDGDGGTVHFSVDGQHYEIDLLHTNKTRLLADLQPYIEVARAVQPGAKRGKLSAAKTAPSDAKKIRSWAAAEGLALPGRGRIPQKVREAYDAAH